MNTPKTSSDESSNSFNDIIQLAENNTDEGWRYIDSQLPLLCNEPEVVARARDNILHKEEGLRDLAASILEASSISLTTLDTQNLKMLMKDQGYPGFRAACALAKRITEHDIAEIIGKEPIKEKLEYYTQDNNVSEIAKKYLHGL